MKKEIKQLGNSKGITFSPEECRIYGLNGNPLDVGDILYVEIIRIKQKDTKE